MHGHHSPHHTRGAPQRPPLGRPAPLRERRLQPHRQGVPQGGARQGAVPHGHTSHRHLPVTLRRLYHTGRIRQPQGVAHQPTHGPARPRPAPPRCGGADRLLRAGARLYGTAVGRRVGDTRGPGRPGTGGHAASRAGHAAGCGGRRPPHRTAEISIIEHRAAVRGPRRRRRMAPAGGAQTGAPKSRRRRAGGRTRGGRCRPGRAEPPNAAKCNYA